jgi:hypothetical protein
MRTSERRALSTAIRRADRRVALKVATIASIGVWCVFAGPFALAPVCWAAAMVVYWRRGTSVLEDLRAEPAAWPVLDAAATAKVVRERTPATRNSRL